jgi:hypothetical protein
MNREASSAMSDSILPLPGGSQPSIEVIQGGGSIELSVAAAAATAASTAATTAATTTTAASTIESSELQTEPEKETTVNTTQKQKNQKNLKNQEKLEKMKAYVEKHIAILKKYGADTYISTDSTGEKSLAQVSTDNLKTKYYFLKQLSPKYKTKCIGDATGILAITNPKCWAIAKIIRYILDKNMKEANKCQIILNLKTNSNNPDLNNWVEEEEDSYKEHTHEEITTPSIFTSPSQLFSQQPLAKIKQEPIASTASTAATAATTLEEQTAKKSPVVDEVHSTPSTTSPDTKLLLTTTNTVNPESVSAAASSVFSQLDVDSILPDMDTTPITETDFKSLPRLTTAQRIKPNLGYIQFSTGDKGSSEESDDSNFGFYVNVKLGNEYLKLYFNSMDELINQVKRIKAYLQIAEQTKLQDKEAYKQADMLSKQEKYKAEETKRTAVKTSKEEAAKTAYIEDLTAKLDKKKAELPKLTAERPTRPASSMIKRNQRSVNKNIKKTEAEIKDLEGKLKDPKVPPTFSQKFSSLGSTVKKGVFGSKARSSSRSSRSSRSRFNRTRRNRS